jgi:predicted anti-sigma-YlaC factor YlaD
MKPPITNPESSCSKSALLEFLDGELAADKEQEIAAHIQTCTACQNEIKRHQKLLIQLDNSFDELPKIPDDFSKIVSANARSQVSGVRKPRERRLAMLICVGLLVTILLAIMAGSLNALSGSTLIFEKAASVTSFVFGLLSDLILSLGIVGRAVSSSFGASPLIILGVIFATTLIIAAWRIQKTTRISAADRPNR